MELGGAKEKEKEKKKEKKKGGRSFPEEIPFVWTRQPMRLRVFRSRTQLNAFYPFSTLFLVLVENRLNPSSHARESSLCVCVLHGISGQFPPTF